MRDPVLRSFFESPDAMRGGVELVDDDIKCIVVNKTTADALRATADAIAGRRASELGVSPASIATWKQRFIEARTSGAAVRFEYRSDNGSPPVVIRAVVNYAGEGDGGPQFTFTAEDVTALATAAHALRRTEESYATLVRNLTGTVYRCDPKRERFEFVSSRCHAVTGYTSEELTAGGLTSLDALIHPDDAPTVRSRFVANIAGRHECNVEYRIIHRDGTTRWVWDRAEGVLSDSGVLEHVDGLVLDVTQRRKEAEERQGLREQLFHAQRVDSIGRLAGGVAHDFNNLLSVVLGHTELIAGQIRPDDPLGEHVVEIRSAVDRSIHLTRQLLGFARRQPIAPRVVDLNEAVANSIRLIRRLIGEGVDVRWQPDATTWPVKVDTNQIDQVLTNLCLNARDAMQGAGHLTIGTGNAVLDEAFVKAHDGARPGQYTELLVEDSGCGMDAATLERVFEPFFTTKPSGQGTGLGLSTVYGIIKQNEGYVDVQSTPGAGTAVRVYFPRYTDAAVAPVEVADIPETEHGTETILLVEDDTSLLKLTARTLEQLGYTVFAADNHSDAIRHAVINMDSLDLLLTDVMMPRMNGRELAAVFLAERQTLAVLYMSGYGQAAIRDGQLDPSAPFLAKPFTTAQLASKVRDVLRRRPAEQR